VPHDPPAGFAASEATPLPRAASLNTSIGGEQGGPPPLALAGTTAFVASPTSVQVIDTTSGSTIGQVIPKYSVATAPGQSVIPPPPLVTTFGGRQAVLAGYLVSLPGHGTIAPGLAIEIDAIDPSGHRLQAIVAPLSGQLSQLLGGPTVTIVGASGGAVVIAEGDRDDGYLSEAVDLDTRTVLWRNRSLLVEALAGQVAIGTLDTSSRSDQGANGDPSDGVHFVAVDLRSGRAAWRLPERLLSVNVQSDGAGTALLEGVDYASARGLLELIDTATGNAQILSRAGTSSGAGAPWTCTFDERSTYICNMGAYGTRVFALDGSTGQLLWQLPNEAQNRITPDITAAWHGAVYGTTPSGPVVLDARTGRDRDDSPGIAPVLVDPYVGIAANQSASLQAFPAIR
jgi:hypothetical protein